jgi:4a-hydroxytetrahydrobiopterin dehydratase
MMAIASNEPSISVIFGRRSTVRDIGELAETEGHHPDVSFGWGYATISLRTKKIKGLHENDFIMASKIDRMFDGLERPPDRQ